MAIEILKPEWGASRPIRGILFDMDGLVVDTEKLYSRFWIEACRHYGFPMTREQALEMRSLSKEAGQAKLVSFFGPEASYPVIRARRIELMDAYIAQHGVEARPGARELLEHLKARGIPCAITSSSPAERIQSYLEPLGLYGYFDRILSGHDVPRGKPAPDIYLYGAAALGLRPGECLALEDSPAGVCSAYAAGCLTVMVPDQDLPDENTKAMLFAVAQTLADVIGMV